MMLKRLLDHPLTRGMLPDDPQTTLLRRQIISGKPFLRNLYTEWYKTLERVIPEGFGAVLELGAGAGFLKDVVPGAIASELFPMPGIDVVMDGQRLPMRDASLKALLMVDVFHHLPDVERFLTETVRCLRPSGCLAMVEPWVTPWSHFVYARLHSEPYEPEAAKWAFPSTGPLSGANSALPWIVFERDRKLFQRKFPELEIVSIELGYPMSYIVSGGVSMRSLTPRWSYSFWRAVERCLSPWNRQLAMFACIIVRRRATDR